MSRQTDERDDALAAYVGRQPTTHRMPVLQQAERVAVIPVERHVCDQHSGVCVEIAGIKEDVRDIRTVQREQGKEIDRLRMLPWRVVGAAVGGGGGVAGLIELLRALVA